MCEEREQRASESQLQRFHPAQVLVITRILLKKNLKKIKNRSNLSEKIPSVGGSPNPVLKFL